MTPNELEAYDAMMHDRDRWRERAERLERLYLSDATACSAYEQAFECWCFLGGRGTLVPESRTQFEEGLPIQVEPQDLIAFFEHNADVHTPLPARANSETEVKP
jgi:hypothetical protein